MDLFPSDISTVSETVSQLFFQYKVVENSEDVRDLLDISDELSLKLVAKVLKGSGSGKYLNERKREQGTTEILAVLKCTTEKVMLDTSAKPRNEIKEIKAERLGTHYVRSVIYGGEMVASLKLKSSDTLNKQQIDGNAKIELPFVGFTAGLEAKLNKLLSECNNHGRDVEIAYYGTHLPAVPPTDVEELMKSIQEFPTRLNDINNGRGIAMQFELQPLENLLLDGCLKYKENPALRGAIGEMFDRFEDLQLASSLATKYLEMSQEDNEMVDRFLSTVSKLIRAFRQIISKMNVSGDDDQFDQCIETYEEALNGSSRIGKFAKHWMNNIAKELKPMRTLKLPTGEPLTIVLLGKTGNGKSSTGNQIIGRNAFEESPDASSVTKHCKYERRKEEREIRVIDTPGVLDTSVIQKISEYCDNLPKVESIKQSQGEILQEIARMFAMAPNGFHAICLVVPYGSRFTLEDLQALNMLLAFLGHSAREYMTVILTHGDDAKWQAEKESCTVEEVVKQWLTGLPKEVKEFMKHINDRYVLFDNRLSPQKCPDDSTRQVATFLQVIDDMVGEKQPYINELTGASRKVLDEQIKRALDSSGLTTEIEKVQIMAKALEEKEKNEQENEYLCQMRKDTEARQKEIQKKLKLLTDKIMEEQAKDAERETFIIPKLLLTAIILLLVALVPVLNSRH